MLRFEIAAVALGKQVVSLKDILFEVDYFTFIVMMMVMMFVAMIMVMVVIVMMMLSASASSTHKRFVFII